MKRMVLTAVLINLVLIQAAHAGVKFARYKFQPDKTYEIEIFHKNIMKFKFNDESSEGAVPLDRVIPLENQVLFNATLRTYPISGKSVVPVKMHLKNFATLIKSGKNMIPQNEAANNELKGKEFLGELDASGAIALVSGRSETDAVPAGDASIFMLLDMIPDLPEGAYDAGSVLLMNSAGKFISAPEKDTAVALMYRITEVKGDDVHVEITDSARKGKPVLNEAESIEPGTSGELIYSQKDNICTYITLTTVFTSEPEKEELKTKGVVLNTRLFQITITAVE